MTVEPRFMEEPADPAFEKMIPDSLEVVRAKAMSYQRTRKIGFGSLGLRSFWSLYTKAKALIAEKKIDLIFISNPPWYTPLIGSLLKRKYRIPLVIDYIDPWVHEKDPIRPFFSKAFWAEFAARLLDPTVVKSADAIVSVSEPINQSLKTLYPSEAKKVAAAIPYGIESADMDFAKKYPEKIPYFNCEDGLCHIVYVGVVWTLLLPTLEALFMALSDLKRQKPDYFKRLQWHFLGTSYALNAPPQVLPIAKKFGVEEVVQEDTGRVSYPMTLNLLSRAQILLALGPHDTHYASSKIYSCFIARRPIFGIYYEKSSATEILKSSNAGRLVTFSDQNPVQTKIAEIEKAIEGLLEFSGQNVNTDLTIIEEYSAKNMTKKLAQVFDSVV